MRKLFIITPSIFYLFLIICFSFNCKTNDKVLITFNDSYGLLQIDDLLSTNPKIDLNIKEKMGDESDLLSKSFPMRDGSKKVLDYNIKTQYIPFFSRAYKKRKMFNSTFLNIRKRIGVPGSKEEYKNANVCYNGYNFIHDGFAIMNNWIYYYAEGKLGKIS